MPGVCEMRSELLEADEDDPMEPEDMPLIFPSGMEASLQKSGCLRNLVTKEIAFRDAKCKDSLAGMRRERRLLIGLIRKYSIQLGPTTRTSTKTRTVLAAIADKIARSTETYQVCRNALEVLNPGGAWSVRFKVLLPADISGPYRDSDLEISTGHELLNPEAVSGLQLWQRTAARAKVRSSHRPFIPVPDA